MDPNTNVMQPETHFVFRRLTENLKIGGREFDAHLWLVILVPLLVVGLVYIAWMYVRDGRTIGAGPAVFLAFLRAAVYFILAWIFLLPAREVWEKTETRSKVVLLFDVSASMGTKDDLPTESMPVDKILSRQDKVIQLLTDAQIAFLEKLQKKNPVTVYRFGSMVDEESKVLAHGRVFSTEEWNEFSRTKGDRVRHIGGRDFSASAWSEWLKPNPRPAPAAEMTEAEAVKFRKKAELHAQLVNGTNLGEALLGTLNREANNIVQGIIVVSDGRSTQFSTQTFDEVRSRADKAQVPIFTVGVGEHRLPINIRVTEVLAPDQARPDDKFPVRVEIDGEGLPDQEITAVLDVYKPEADKPSLEMKATARFKPGEPPHAQVEFLIDPAQMPVELRKADASAGKPEMLEGKWKFVARVPKHKQEIFLPAEHVSDPELVNVIKKPIRILLFASAPTRDYQFARTLFVREVDQKRAELSIFLQLARPEIVQDVPAERLLRDFPSSIRDVEDPNEKPEDKFSNLMQYDVIVAFDPDWTKLQPEQLALLEKWVSNHDGGLVLVGGPINTFQLTRGINQEMLRPLLNLYPVVLEDNRIQGIDRSTAEPWRLHFPGATSETEFLKLDEDSGDLLSGWEKFFTGRDRSEDGGAPALVRRGFFDYYPVREVKTSAHVVATFTDPRARMKDGKEQPYVVTMPYGGGKVVYLGSGELWRLRQYREAFHERFWTKLCRFAGSGSQSGKKSRGVIVMGKNFTANQFVRVEARLYGRDLAPLPMTEKPRATIKPPTGVPVPPAVELQPKPTQGSEWEGWFAGRFLVNAPGNYELQLAIPGTTDTLSSKFTVKESNPELDNTKPDFARLQQVAGAASEIILGRVNEETRDKLGKELERTNSPWLKDNDRTLRLFFDLKPVPRGTGERPWPSAELIPECLETEVRVQKNRTSVTDLWDAGFRVGKTGQKISFALFAIVALLSIEWLTRKLLKLA